MCHQSIGSIDYNSFRKLGWRLRQTSLAAKEEPKAVASSNGWLEDALADHSAIDEVACLTLFAAHVCMIWYVQAMTFVSWHAWSCSQTCQKVATFMLIVTWPYVSSIFTHYVSCLSISWLLIYSLAWSCKNTY